mmetsp:Transcript_14789/g.32732  ORF Transcript_14789/g.32732 Transcript_14789/m.32732 type:complete len:105 (-) Transcript_14789:605-919(-)
MARLPIGDDGEETTEDCDVGLTARRTPFRDAGDFPRRRAPELVLRMPELTVPVEESALTDELEWRLLPRKKKTFFWRTTFRRSRWQLVVPLRRHGKPFFVVSGH